LADITGVSWKQIREFVDELFGDEQFLGHLQKYERDFHLLKMASTKLFAKKVLVQYAVLRALAPNLMVETGIANGVSSFYVLGALRRNGKGCLYSIEVNNPSYLPPGREPGWLVARDLRDRWRVIIGSSESVLPNLLRELK